MCHKVSQTRCSSTAIVVPLVFVDLNFKRININTKKKLCTIEIIYPDLFQVHNLRPQVQVLMVQVRVQVRVLSPRVRVQVQVSVAQVRVRVQVLMTNTRVLVLVTKTQVDRVPVALQGLNIRVL